MNASLRTKIYLGFAVIVSLLVVNGFVAYSGLARLRAEAASKQNASDVNAQALAIDRDVQELSLHVDRYVTAGSEPLQEEVTKLHARIRREVETGADQSAALIAERFQRIGEHVDEYITQFASVVEERRIREDLVKRQLPEQAAGFREKLASLTAEIESGGAEDGDRLALSLCKANFAEAERALLSYFASPDSQTANSAVAALDDAAGALAGIGSEATRSDVVESIEEFGRIGLRAVQATRSYLFFRNVVMAGEASEITYNSKMLRQLSKEKQQLIDQEFRATSEKLNRITAATVLAAIVLASVIAGRLAFRIVQPIAALTRTFARLSEGESLDRVPGVDRQDEIGRMARAAEVFSEKNRTTAELLEQSESLRRKLQIQAEQLELTNQELDSFAYVASHDLKSPLRGIRQLASWIEEDAFDALPAPSQEHLRQLRSRVQKMELLLSDLLEFSRIGRMAPEAESVSVADLVSDIVEITDNPEGVGISVPNDLPTFETLRSPLEQVLMNLVGNAIKHNHRGPEGRVELSWTDEGSQYRFTVRDDGPGIDASNHERVFQMYQRVGDPTVEGSGMGLALVKKQVEHLGGEVTLDSRLGDGAAFSFTWPMCLNQSTQEPNGEAA